MLDRLDHLRASRAAAAALILLLGASGAAFAANPDAAGGFPLERQDDPPILGTSLIQATTPPAVITFGRFTSVQVNLNAAGQNVVKDAANEPSLAVDPTNPDRIAIGWRQFDTDHSNFRQAGYAFSTNGGVSWTTGVIDPGVFRSDPVLGFDTQGKFFYNSLTGDLHCWVFPSVGATAWGGIVDAYGGDKQWMTIDRTSGPGHHQMYESWSSSGNPYAPHIFSRSVDAGQSFQPPTDVPSSPLWGTLDVGPDGTLYLVGTSDPPGPIYVARSTDAQNAAVTPSFNTSAIDLGGIVQMGGPNPVGLLGQLWIAVDRSGGPRNGWIYVLGSVRTPTDPLDVMFIRSTDGGQTWSAPRRVNDDPTGTRAFQWFGTMSVSPDGRIDAVWNDTRGSADSTKSALYYSYSFDGGATWSPNEKASPVWDSTVGWPRQNKIGDYYHMISRTDGADLAWAATFNGEQDVYFMRIASPVTGVAEARSHRLQLGRSSPNPFASSTRIRFDVPAGGERAKLEVYDAAGRRVATLVDGFVAGGEQSAGWSGVDQAGRAVKPGLYLARLQAPGVAETAKLMLLK